MTHRRTAFTLVELLVVIGIIAVLIAMLMPALSRAQRQARQVACLSNLRQFHLAMVHYAHEFRDVSIFSTHVQPRWCTTTKIGRYLGTQAATSHTFLNLKRLTCPSDPLADEAWISYSSPGELCHQLDPTTNPLKFSRYDPDWPLLTDFRQMNADGMFSWRFDRGPTWLISYLGNRGWGNWHNARDGTNILFAAGDARWVTFKEQDPNVFFP